MINTIIFDLGKVLINWDPQNMYKKVFKSEEEMNYFLNNVCTLDWNEEQDAGRTIEEGNAALINKFPEHETNIRLYYERWEEMLGGPIEGTAQVFKRFKANPNLKIYALTNWSAELFPIAQQKFEFLNWFDGLVVSGVEKIRKPAPEFYHLLLNRYSVDPSKALFIDDSLRNIEAAKKLGINCIHFTSPEALEDELKAYSL